MRDLMNDIHTQMVIAPQVVTDDSSLLSAVVDRQGYESVTFVIVLGTIADSDATWTVAVQEGSTSTQSAHTAVADADLIGTEALAGFQFDDDGETRKIGYKGSERYCSIEIDNDTTNTGNLPIAVLAILGHPLSRPTDNPPA